MVSALYFSTRVITDRKNEDGRMRSYDLPNYDSYINRYNPYDDDELDETLEEHFENLRAMDYEDDQRDYCEAYKLSFYEIEHHLK